jgi:hypothetical protein
MKNTLMTLALVFLTSIAFSQNKTVKAFYEGYDELFFFSDVEEDSYEFATVAPAVLKEFKLKDESLVGKSYLVTYSVKIEEDEDGDEMEIYHIISLKAIKLERVAPDYNEEED